MEIGTADLHAVNTKSFAGNSSAITHYYEAITIPDFSDDNTSQETTVETWFEPPRITPQQSLPSPTNAPSITGSGASSGSVPLPKKKKIRQPGSHNKKAQDDPTLAPWAIRPEFIPDDGKERSKSTQESALPILQFSV